MNAAEILALDDKQVITVQVPEWKTTVCVRDMSGEHRDLVEAERRKPVPQNIEAMVACYTVCDPQGNLLFTPEQVPSIAKKNRTALTRIVIAAASLSAITDEEIEVLKKTSATIRSGDSATA